MGKTLLLDNYDSFTYNLLEVLRRAGYSEIDVIRNDRITVEEAGSYERFLLSPGPGLPEEAGILKELIRRWGAQKPILGVCLGHQAIAEVYGGSLLNLGTVVHGKARNCVVTDENDPLFMGLPAQFSVGRYHSWVVDKKTLPDALRVTAEDVEGVVMALRHEEYRIAGVQFHPESVLTEHGEQLLRNWMEHS